MGTQGTVDEAAVFHTVTLDAETTIFHQAKHMKINQVKASGQDIKSRHFEQLEDLARQPYGCNRLCFCVQHVMPR